MTSQRIVHPKNKIKNKALNENPIEIQSLFSWLIWRWGKIKVKVTRCTFCYYRNTTSHIRKHLYPIIYCHPRAYLKIYQKTTCGIMKSCKLYYTTRVMQQWVLCHRVQWGSIQTGQELCCLLMRPETLKDF